MNMWPAERKPDLFAFSSNFILWHFCCVEGKTNGQFKVSAISGKWFWSYNDRQQKEQTIDLYSAYLEKIYRHLFNLS